MYLYTKRWYFVLHVARCVIISPFFLFSLSHSFWHHFLSSPLPFPRTSLLFSALSTRWRNTPLYFPLPPPPFFIFLPFHHFSFLSSRLLLPSSCCRLSPSQCDGLSGWFLQCSRPLCKYACLSYTASLVTHVFLPLVSGFSSVKRRGSNP